MRLIIALCLISMPASAVHINEIMYNPPGDDDNFEYVEIFMDADQSLANWTIGDISSNDTLVLVYAPDMGVEYALIVEDGYRYENGNFSVYSAGASIGNGLNNAEDTIYLYDANGSLVDSVHYAAGFANDNGRSLELFNGSWHESFGNGTPGYANSCEPPVIADDDEIHGSICDAVISIRPSKDIYEDGEKAQFSHVVEDCGCNFSIDYWIEDLEGRIVKTKVTSSNTNQKSWTTEKGAFLLKALLHSGCDANATNNDAYALIGVRGDAKIVATEIEIVGHGKAGFGSVMDVSLIVSKGETSKQVVEVYAVDDDDKRISSTSKIKLMRKNIVQELTLPVFIKPDCDVKHADGNYTLVAEGLGEEVEENIMIEGRVCEVPLLDKNSVLVCPKEASLPKIKSFYTLAKKYNENIRLFAGLDHELNLSVVLYSKDGTRESDVDSSRMEFIVNASHGRNLYMIELIHGGRVVDSKVLIVEFDESPVEDTETKKQSSSKPSMAESIQMVDDQLPITGHAAANVYESSSKKGMRIAGYAMIPVAAIGLVALWKQKRLTN